MVRFPFLSFPSVTQWGRCGVGLASTSASCQRRIAEGRWGNERAKEWKKEGEKNKVEKSDRNQKGRIGAV